MQDHCRLMLGWIRFCSDLQMWVAESLVWVWETGKEACRIIVGWCWARFAFAVFTDVGGGMV